MFASIIVKKRYKISYSAVSTKSHIVITSWKDHKRCTSLLKIHIVSIHFRAHSGMLDCSMGRCATVETHMANMAKFLMENAAWPVLETVLRNVEIAIEIASTELVKVSLDFISAFRNHFASTLLLQPESCFQSNID